MQGPIIVCIMDRNSWKARTDIIVIVRTKEKTLEWVPRDLYSKFITNRINVAYARGGEDLLIKSLHEFNIFATACVCILPDCVNDNFNYIGEIAVPVSEDMTFKYPLHRHQPIEEGHRIIEFHKPRELLSGDRFHEWVGARYRIPATINKYPDFDRIRRQQILLKELLHKKHTFSHSPTTVRGLTPDIIAVLSTINSSWIIKSLRDIDYRAHTIRGISVMLPQNI